jgi:hypothetical protein
VAVVVDTTRMSASWRESWPTLDAALSVPLPPQPARSAASRAGMTTCILCFLFKIVSSGMDDGLSVQV